MKKIKNWFYPKQVKIGDIGIYHHKVSYLALGAEDPVTHNFYHKVKVLDVFEGLVEVETISICSMATDNCIKVEEFKFLNPEKLKWQIQ